MSHVLFRLVSLPKGIVIIIALLLLMWSLLLITDKILCSKIFTILLPGFYQSPRAIGKSFNIVSIFVQWNEFWKASVQICDAIINLKGQKLQIWNIKGIKMNLGITCIKINKFVNRWIKNIKEKNIWIHMYI